MLYLNNKRYELSPKELEDLNKKFPKFPVVIKYPAKLMKYDALNKKEYGPNSMPIPMETIVQTPKGAQQWQYADNEVKRGDNLVRTPRVFEFKGKDSIGANQIELLFFLYVKSQYAENGLNSKGARNHIFTFENKEAEAKYRFDKKAAKRRLENFLDDEVKAPRKVLDKIAGAYFLTGTEGMGDYELRETISETVARDHKGGYGKFFDTVESLDAGNSAVNQLITKAVEFGVLKHNKSKLRWEYVHEDGKHKTTLIEVQPSEDAWEKLSKYLMVKADAYKKLEGTCDEAEFKKLQAAE